MISFGTTYWFILLLAIITAAVGVTLILYFRNKAHSGLSKWQLWTLTGLRFLSFFLIAFLLLSPFLRSLKKITQNPIIVSAWDDSNSMIADQDSALVAGILSELQSKIKTGLGSDYELVNYTFGNQVSSGEVLGLNEKRSDYSELLSTVSNNHFNQNIGALIIAGDGIYNEGRNPVNIAGELSFPVYSIGFGDTSIVSDSRISNIRMNRTAFAGNKFPVEVDVQLSKVKDKTLKLSILLNETEIASEMIIAPNDNFFITKDFILDAGSPGLQHYKAKIQYVENERNVDNNSFEFVINILENKQKILILSDGWHPDIGAISNTLEQQLSYEVSVFTEEPYPENLSDFNLVILNQLPTAGKSVAQVMEKVRSGRLPLLIVVGNKTFIPQLNALSQGVKIELLAGSGEEAQPGFNPSYSTFSLSEDFLSILPQFPPLQVPFADFEMDATFSPLLYQKLKGIETGRPLMATGKVDNRKVGFILGEGIWRWRLYDYYQNQSHLRFDELVNQLIQYLALRENEDNFIVEFKPVFTETDDVVLNAEVYNDAFERVTGGEVNIILKNSNNEEYTFTFDAHGEDYLLNADHLPVGDYSFVAEVKLGDQTYTETGNFTVVSVNLEKLVTRANHTLLYQLSLQSGGVLYSPADVDKLIGELKNGNQLKATIYFQEMISELLNLRWLFVVFLMLLSVEWFLRKYWGIY